MRSLDYERSGSDNNEEEDGYNEKCLKKFLESEKKQREIYENQIVAEKILLEIMAGKRMIKRNAQMREEDKERKLRSGMENADCIEKPVDNSHGATALNCSSGFGM
ncbi:hypothetical protein POM88_036172 [Heracleum sosnowskyi]|uniref:Uncharacterized protein n=1 Tax=Heracleum sosnowskyi TaxID=360622 RepID=A0AAD8MC68_9APIA|nr:hypothetical protein POM88_036172 [Heracleum sosnowskyi]